MIPLDRNAYAPSRAGVLRLPWYSLRTNANHERVAVVVLQSDAVRRVLRSGLPPSLSTLARRRAYSRQGGSLEGLEGIFLKTKSDWRIMVSVAMLQRSVAVEIDREWITTI
jgi:hypothetical protein